MGKQANPIRGLVIVSPARKYLLSSGPPCRRDWTSKCKLLWHSGFWVQVLGSLNPCYDSGQYCKFKAQGFEFIHESFCIRQVSGLGVLAGSGQRIPESSNIP